MVNASRNVGGAAARASGSRSARGVAAGLAALAAFATGCGAEAEVPEVVVTRSDVRLDGVGVLGALELTASVEFDHPVGFEMPRALEARLWMTDATLTVTEGVSDLEFLRALTLELGTRAEGGPETQVLATYSPPAEGPPADSTVHLTSAPEVDVLRYWTTDQAFYRLTVTGALPSEDWVLELRGRFAGELSL